MIKSRGLLLSVLLLCAPAVAAQPEATAAVNAFFQAMSAGDVSRIKEAIADPLKSRVLTLLETNAEYPGLLADRYGDARITIIESVPLAGQRIKVRVDVLKSSGTLSEMALILTRNKQGTWLISDQVTE